MDTVKVSPKFQVVIPQEIRKDLKLKPGEKLVIMEKGGTIHLIPVGKIKELRGFIKTVSTKALRDENERFD
ncbi:MAG: AbrB/MazE/SpoVT family DNA-binding domain-containing protein [Candidatus Aenigmarchaeota archaeon]|nr:AbrB/MazE/SpoVT family DNA-binding domain-containing protein [Candidatus Aenigmarchaeota archaeon]